MSALNPADAVTFGKIIALFGSTHEGEQLAALNRASAFLSARSVGWTDIGEALKRPPVVYQLQPSAPSRSHQLDARRCLSSVVVWKPHEAQFLQQMAAQHRRPSDKQRDWLDGLLDRVEQSGRRAA